MKSSWKEKVDPALDRVIRYYLRVIDRANLPFDTGWPAVDAECLKVLEKKEAYGWISHYEEYLDLETYFMENPLGKKNLPEEEAREHKDDFRKWLWSETEGIPEESRKFYKKKFEPLYSIDAFHELLNGQDKEKISGFYRDMVNHMFVLEMHKQMPGSDLEREAREAQQDLCSPAMFMQILIGIYNALSLLAFRIPIYELVKEAKAGDARAFFKVLRIDRTAVEFEWARQMIRKAQLTADREFFRKMTEAVMTGPLGDRSASRESLILVLLFWRFGLGVLDNGELFDLIKDAGVKIEHERKAFGRFIDEEVRPIFSSA